MHFERSLRRAIYPPWKDKYIDYQKLKTLLHDSGSDAGSSAGGADDDDGDRWTEQDESAFVEELVNVQLEKIHAFQNETLQRLRERTGECEKQLDGLLVEESASSGGDNKPTESDKPDGPNGDDDDDSKGKDKKQAASPSKSTNATGTRVVDGGHERLQALLGDLDAITREMNELEKYSRINYTGFLKAAKKHDRRRGHSYRVRPLMQVRLQALPFNQEDYSPLLYRCSALYALIRSNLDPQAKPFAPEETAVGDRFTSYKFWVHPDNLLELKTIILRRLPVLVYNANTSKVAEGTSPDPTVTSIYFDDPKFSLYSAKVDHKTQASSLRLRWYDQLSENPEIYCEKKTVYEDDTSSETKITTKTKYVQAFLAGDYKLDKDVQKQRERTGAESGQVRQLEADVAEIQSFVKEHSLQPVLRANYTRTAFQIPGDNRVRITVDTNLALIREDALDPDRPCREPDDWHRRDIDDADMDWPYPKIRKGEINRFPFAVLEIRVKGNKHYEWVSELINSHLVKQTNRFSKFVHGVAELFDDYVNTLPFWINEIDSDIRKDPQQAFDQEKERRQQLAEDETAVGSLLKKASPGLRQSLASPSASPGYLSERHNSVISVSHLTPGKATVDMTRRHKKGKAAAADGQENGKQPTADAEDSDEDDVAARPAETTGLASYWPSLTKYGKRRGGRVKLPPGVSEPSFWIKDEGPVKIEAKVWLANQRTYIKWQHVAVLLATLSLGLYNAAAEHNKIARTLAAVYTVLGIFIALWGYGLYLYRSSLIRRRSGKDLDFILGPVIVCVGLSAALLINFGLKYQSMKHRQSHATDSNSTNSFMLDDL